MSSSKKRKGYLDTLMDVDPLGETLEKASKLVKKLNKGQIIPLENGTESDSKAEYSASEQVDKSTSRHLSKQLLKHLPKQVDKSTSEQVDISTSRQMGTADTRQVDTSTDQHLDKSTSEQVNTMTSRQVEGEVGKIQRPANLKRNQFSVLRYIYFNRPFKVSGPEGIHSVLDIRYGTVRYILQSLTKKGYIKKPFSINDGVNKGCNCIVNEAICKELFGDSKIINPIDQLDMSASQQLDKLASRHLNMSASEQLDKLASRHLNMSASEQEHPLNSSSSYINKLTTTKDEDIYSLNHPELVYWKDLNLKERQMNRWKNEFDLSTDDLFESLKHCRYDICVNEIEIKKTPFDYFFGRLKKAGFYHPPKNYTSHEEQAIEREKQRLRKTQAQAHELKEIRLKQQKAEFDVKFQEMLNDPECRLYQECLEMLNAFEKKRGKGKAFENAMRSALNKKINKEDHK